MRLPAFAALVAAAPIAVAAAARASPSSRLVYSRAPEASSCPDESELRKAVARRFGYDPFFPWAKQTVVVQILRARGRYVARVQLLDEQGIAHGTRELASSQSDCSEIFEASALAVSIALDAPAKPVTQEAPTEEQSPPAPPSPPPAPTAATPSPEPPAAATPERPLSAKPSSTTRVQLDVGADALASTGVTPSVTPGVSAFARARREMWSLSLEIRVDWPQSQERSVDIGGGSVQAWLMAGGLVPCLHVSYFALCAVGWLGALQASGQNVEPQSSKSAPFLAAGGRIGFEWPLSGAVAVRTHAEGVANLYRSTLALGSSAVWSAPPAAGTLGAGVAVRF